ncbi:MAG: hypothetical protein ABIQ31_08285 [Ferruginibacter sp.]
MNLCLRHSLFADSDKKVHLLKRSNLLPVASWLYRTSATQRSLPTKKTVSSPTLEETDLNNGFRIAKTRTKPSEAVVISGRHKSKQEDKNIIKILLDKPKLLLLHL